MRHDLFSQERESAARLAQAEAAAQQAGQKLNTALEQGRDTSAARRQLHEAKRLVRFAQGDLDRIRGALERRRQETSANAALRMAAEMNQELQAKLSAFQF